MTEELYIDVVSKTLISRLSEAISQFVGERLSETLNKLLLTVMPEVISREFTPALDRVQERMLSSAEESGAQVLKELKEIDTHLAAGLEGLQKAMAGQKDSSQKALGEAVEALKKQMETSIAGQIKKVQESEESVLKELKGINTSLPAGLEGLQKAMAGQKDSSQKALGEAMEALKKQMEASIAGRIKRVEESEEQVLKELKDLRQHAEETALEQKKLLAEELQSHIKGLGAGLNNGMEELQRVMADLKEKDNGVLRDTLEALKGDMENNVVRRLKTVEASGERLSNGLKEIVETLEDNARKQGGLLAEDLHGNLKKLGAEFTVGMEELKKGMAGQKDLSQKAFGNTVEMLKGHLEKSIAAHLKAVEEPGKQARKELNNILEEVKRIANEQSGLLTNIFYAVKKLDKASYEKDPDITNKIAGTLDMSIEVMTKHIEKAQAIQEAYRAELAGVSQVIKDETKGQADMLNSILYSIKKLTAGYSKEQDISQRFESQFRSALDELYGHIRRLERDKEDMFAEYIRVAGSDYMKSRLEEQEKEIQKAYVMAEKYRQEKREIEERLEQMQTLLGVESA